MSTFLLKISHSHRCEEGRVKLDNASSMALTKVGGLPVVVGKLFFICHGSVSMVLLICIIKINQR